MKIVSLFYGIVIVLVFASCSLLFAYKKISPKRISQILCAGAVCITLTFLLFPATNLFVQFDTPYDAYCATQEGDKALVIEGRNSALVVATEYPSSAYNISLIPQGKNGWKVPGIFNSYRVNHKLFPYLTIEVHRVRNTTDFYVSIYSVGNQIDVFDSKNSVFYMLDSNESNRGIIYAYYAWVDSLDETYSLTVNGDKIL